MDILPATFSMLNPFTLSLQCLSKDSTKHVVSVCMLQGQWYVWVLETYNHNLKGVGGACVLRGGGGGGGGMCGFVTSAES